MAYSAGVVDCGVYLFPMAIVRLNHSFPINIPLTKEKTKLDITPQGANQPYTVGFFGVIALVGAVLLYLYGSMLNSSPLTMTSFIVLAGVAEEWFFRMFLCTWIYRFTHTAFLAVPISSLLWAVFHIGRVSGETVTADNLMFMGMFGILIAGVVLSYIFVGFRFEPFNTQRLFVTIIATVVSFVAVYYVSSVLAVGGGFDYLLLVFLAGLPLGYITLLFKSADGPTFGHMLVNALSGR